MSRERDKLIAVLNELEKDYRAGNIPQEKYISLRERYMHKIDTIDASNRVRAMRSRDNQYNRHSKRNYHPNPRNSGRDNQYNRHSKRNYHPNPRNSGRDNPNYRNSKPKGYYDESGKFHPYNSKPYNDRNLNNYSNKRPIDDVPEKTKSKTSVALVALFTVILLVAFGSGIAMGVFGDGFSLGAFSDLLGTGASINDTAFPIQDQNISSIDYNSTADSSSNYTSSSSDYSSYSSSDSSSSYSSSDEYGSDSSSGSGSDSSSGSGSDSGSGSESNQNYNSD